MDERTQLLNIFWHGGKWWQRWNESDICLARANWLHIKCSRSRFSLSLPCCWFCCCCMHANAFFLYVEHIFDLLWCWNVEISHTRTYIWDGKGMAESDKQAHTSNEPQSMQKMKQINYTHNFRTMSTLYSVVTRKWNDNENKNRNCRFCTHSHTPHVPSFRANEKKWHILREWEHRMNCVQSMHQLPKPINIKGCQNLLFCN